VKKLLLLLPLLFIQSCESANQIALKCKLHTVSKYASSEFKFDDDVSYLIDYTKNEISAFTDKKIYKFKNLVLAPEVISFTIPNVNGDEEMSINRNSLVVSGGRSEVVGYFTKKITGKCSKTSLPNLSSYGKQI